MRIYTRGGHPRTSHDAFGSPRSIEDDFLARVGVNDFSHHVGVNNNADVGSRARTPDPFSCCWLNGGEVDFHAVSRFVTTGQQPFIEDGVQHGTSRAVIQQGITHPHTLVQERGGDLFTGVANGRTNPNVLEEVVFDEVMPPCPCIKFVKGFPHEHVGSPPPKQLETVVTAPGNNGEKVAH